MSSIKYFENDELHTLIPFRKNEKFGYYSRVTGKVEDINYLRASPFTNDLAHVIQKGWYPSIIDSNFECLYMFPKGISIDEIINPREVIISIEDYPRPETGLVDLTNKRYISNPPKDFIGKKPKIAYHRGCSLKAIYKDGLCLVNDYEINRDNYIGNSIGEKLFASRSKRYGYKNVNNDLVIDCIFLRADEFSEGLAAVAKEDKWGFINTTGELIIDYRFDSVGGFSEGLCWFEENNKRGFIDMDGNVVIKPVFGIADGFSEGLAFVTDEKWGSGYFINKDSFVIIPPKYSFFSKEFKSGLTLVDLFDNEKEKLWGAEAWKHNTKYYIDKNLTTYYE